MANAQTRMSAGILILLNEMQWNLTLQISQFKHSFNYKDLFEWNKTNAL